jgi:hypothetical protein
MSTTRASICLERNIGKGAFLESIGLFRARPSGVIA